MYTPQKSTYYILIGASLSEPHHMRSTVKSVFLLACLLEALPYMAKNLFKCKQTLHQVHGVLATLHQTRGVLTIACAIKC